MITTETDVRLLFPFAMDSIFKIKGQVYEVLDRAIGWNVQEQRESFKYRMRKFGDEGNWFDVSHEQIISKDYEVVHRALFMRNKRKWMK